MNPTFIPKLSSLIWEYYDGPELSAIAKLFGIDIPEAASALATKHEFLILSQSVVDNIDQGNTRAFVETLLEQLRIRNAAAIASTSFERRQSHESLEPLLRDWYEGLQKEAVPSEIAVPAQKPFAAKAEIREFVEQAQTPLFLVDPYIGLGTLDCLRLVAPSIRVLTATANSAIEAGFSAGLVDFRAEGRIIEVRRASMLHDRHLVFNDRCWLVGSSLKDAGKKAFNCTEIVDSKQIVVADLEARWAVATPYP